MSTAFYVCRLLQVKGLTFIYPTMLALSAIEREEMTPLGMLAITLSGSALAHCDSMDDPVMKDAQRAITEENVTLVLKWVSAKDEDEIRSAFDMTLAVRGESDTAREVADRYFYETLVRVHRASEGEGFTGIKPAGSVEGYLDPMTGIINLTGIAPRMDGNCRAISVGTLKKRHPHIYADR